MVALVAGAPLEGLVVLMGPVARGGTVRAGMLTGFVVAPFGVSNAAVAIIPGVGFGGCNRGKEQKATQSHNRG